MNEFTRKSQSRNAFLILIAPAILLCGCMSSDSDSEETAHVIPAHRPKHFPAAVLAIEKELAQFDSLTEVQHEEFRDIIGWLPELAAETDLKKAKWDQVNQISKQLIEKLDKSKDKFADDNVKSHLSDLKSLARTAIEEDSFNTYQDFEFPADGNAKELDDA